MTVHAIGVAFALLAALFVLRRRSLAMVLGASAAFPTSAALTISGQSVPPFYVIGLAACAGLVVGRTRVSSAMMTSLRVFVFAVAVVTLLGPTLFHGTPILLPRGGIDGQINFPTPLAYTASQAAQVFYLIIGVGVASYVASRRDEAARAVHACFAVGVGVGTLALVAHKAGAPWPDSLFRNYASVNYNPFETRFYGTFSEPSYLAVFSVTAIAFYAARLLMGTRRKALTLLAIAAATAQLVEADSGTAILGGVLVGAGFLTVYLAGFLAGTRKMPPLVAAVGPFAIVAILWFTNAIGSVSDMISEKAASGSATNRFAADRFSLDLLAHTHGIGVGLGANRPSSFLTMLLSCVGVIGLALFVVALVCALRSTSDDPRMVAAKWSLVALVVAKCVAEPAISTPLLWLLFGVIGALSAPSARGDHDRQRDRRARQGLTVICQGSDDGRLDGRSGVASADEANTDIDARPNGMTRSGAGEPA